MTGSWLHKSLGDSGVIVRYYLWHLVTLVLIPLVRSIFSQCLENEHILYHV
ncbi:hypothetical protein V1517DRAFT_273415, partial [Lipomyces orientalis]